MVILAAFFCDGMGQAEGLTGAGVVRGFCKHHVVGFGGGD